MFKDRQDAGRHLAEAFKHYAGEDVLVLAIPRGGIPVAIEVAGRLDAALSVLVSRKLPLPDDPEAGFGAIAEDGSVYVAPWAAHLLDSDTIDWIMREQRDEIHRRIAVLRRGKPLPDLKGKSVLLVDDGIAAGSTMRASIQCCRNLGAHRVVVGAPVTSADVRSALAELVDEIAVLETPMWFRAVAQAYQVWHDVSDQEAVKALDVWERSRVRKRMSLQAHVTGQLHEAKS